ncbi:unnamed protein product [Rhizophagus irregularis]|nr:unnamed protein product [Rhizophagus irregularis]
MEIRYVNAKFHLGYCYVNGIGTKNDKKKGFELYDEAVLKESNDISGWTKNDKKKGFELYDEAVLKESNDISSDTINPNGSFHKNEEEIMRELFDIKHWYQQSAENKSSALYKLGESYELGKGVNISEIKAFYYYKQAAKSGCIYGKYKLAHYFLHGIIVDCDEKKAHNLYKEAAEGGNNDAHEILSALYEQDKETE